MIINKIKIGIIFGLLLSMVNMVCAQNLYRWVDDEGNVHYSDKIPAEKSRGAHTKINKQGVVLKQERSAQELDKEALEDQQSDEQHKQEQIKLAKQRRLDQILLDTFTTEKDLLLTRDERLNMIDSIVNLTISNNQILSKQIETTKTQIEVLENQKREVPENTRKKLENLIGQKKKNLIFIEAKRQERKQREDQFERDLTRFRELRNKSTNGSKPGTSLNPANNETAKRPKTNNHNKTTSKASAQAPSGQEEDK